MRQQMIIRKEPVMDPRMKMKDELEQSVPHHRSRLGCTSVMGVEAPSPTLPASLITSLHAKGLACRTICFSGTRSRSNIPRSGLSPLRTPDRRRSLICFQRTGRISVATYRPRRSPMPAQSVASVSPASLSSPPISESIPQNPPNPFVQILRRSRPILVQSAGSVSPKTRT